MPDKINPQKVSAVKAGALDKKLSLKPELATDLNIILSKEQIQNIVEGIFEAGNLGPGQVALASDYCCVDASVGSSVAGPFSSVGSSVSIDPNLQGMATNIRQRLTADKVRVNVMLPQNLSIR